MKRPNKPFETKKRRTRENDHIIVIVVFADVKIRIINVYRSFRPPNLMTLEAFFAEQLNILKKAKCTNCNILGDLNLDAIMSYRTDNHCKVPLQLLNNFALDNHLV